MRKNMNVVWKFVVFEYKPFWPCQELNEADQKIFPRNPGCLSVIVKNVTPVFETGVFLTFSNRVRVKSLQEPNGGTKNCRGDM